MAKVDKSDPIATKYCLHIAWQKVAVEFEALFKRFYLLKNNTNKQDSLVNRLARSNFVAFAK